MHQLAPKQLKRRFTGKNLAVLSVTLGVFGLVAGLVGSVSGQGLQLDIEYNQTYDCPTSAGYGRMQFKVLSCDGDWCKVWLINSSPQGGFEDSLDERTLDTYFSRTDNKGKGCTVNGRPVFRKQPLPPQTIQPTPPPVTGWQPVTPALPKPQPQQPAFPQMPQLPNLNFPPPNAGLPVRNPNQLPPPDNNPCQDHEFITGKVYECPTSGGYGRAQFRVLSCGDGPSAWCDVFMMNSSPQGGFGDSLQKRMLLGFLSRVDNQGKGCTLNGQPVAHNTCWQPPSPPQTFPKPPRIQPIPMPVTPNPGGMPQLPPGLGLGNPPVQVTPPSIPPQLQAQPPQANPVKPPQIPVMTPPTPEKPPGNRSENVPAQPTVPKPEPVKPVIPLPKAPDKPNTAPKTGDWIMAAPKGDGKFVRCQVMSKVSEAVLRVNCNECDGQPPKFQAVNIANTKPDDPAWKPPVCKPEDKPIETTCNVEKPVVVENSASVQPTDVLFKYLVYKDVCGEDGQCGITFKSFPILAEFVNKADRPGGLLFSQALVGVRMNPVRQTQYSVCRSGAKSEQTGDFVCFQDPAIGNKWDCKAPVQAPPAPPPPPPPRETCPVPPSGTAPTNTLDVAFSTPLMLSLVSEEISNFLNLKEGEIANIHATITAETKTKNGDMEYGVRAHPTKSCHPQPNGKIRWVEQPPIGLRCFKSIGLAKWDCVIDDKYK